MPQAVTEYLRRLNTSERARAAAFDVVYNMDDASAEQTLRSLPFSDDVRATLWDARKSKTAPSQAVPPPSAPPSLADRAVDALPAAGGMAGGIVGGIGGTVLGTPVGGVGGAVGGSALGGAAGQALKQFVNNARGVGDTPSRLAAATDIGKQAAVQGASELGGQGLMKGAGMMAHGLMDFAIRPAPTVAEEFGDIAGTALRERLPVGSILPGATKGSSQAKAAMRESAATTRGLLKDAESAGVSFRPQDVGRGPVSGMVGEIAKQPLNDSELNQVSRMFTEYVNSHPDQITPSALKDMKQAAQRIAKPIYRALNQDNAVPAGEKLTANFNKAIADGAKDSLETIKGMAQSEGRTQDLIGASRAIRRAEVRRLPLIAETAAPLAGAMVGGGRQLMAGDERGAARGASEGVGATLLIRALLSPRSTSRMALGLTEPAVKEIVRQMPRASVYALMTQLQGAEQGEQ